MDFKFDWNGYNYDLIDAAGNAWAVVDGDKLVNQATNEVIKLIPLGERGNGLFRLSDGANLNLVGMFVSMVPNENWNAEESRAAFVQYLAGLGAKEFTQASIRATLRSMGMEARLDAALASDPLNQRDWLEARKLTIQNERFWTVIQQAGFTYQEIVDIIANYKELD